MAHSYVNLCHYKFIDTYFRIIFFASFPSLCVWVCFSICCRSMNIDRSLDYTAIAIDRPWKQSINITIITFGQLNPAPTMVWIVVLWFPLCRSQSIWQLLADDFFVIALSVNRSYCQWNCKTAVKWRVNYKIAWINSTSGVLEYSMEHKTSQRTKTKRSARWESAWIYCSVIFHVHTALNFRLFECCKHSGLSTID